MTFEQGMKHDFKHLYRKRRILSQVLATTVKVMLVFEFGCCLTYSGIVIPALRGEFGKHNANETLSISDTEASWLGGVLFIFEPIGSILSACITDYLGRKRSMMIVTVPYGIAWFMMYQATSVWQIFVANSLLGFGIGLMEAPIMTYVGEICEPSIRGILITYTNMGTSMGGATVYLLNTMMAWRMVALVCMSVPILTFILLYFIPETPHWLLSKNRTADAEKSLCWLRGWVPKEIVATEFEALQNYSEKSQYCDYCIEQNKKCPHPPPNLGQKFTEFRQSRTLKPFFIVISLFMILQFSGIFSMTPYLQQIFKAYQSPLPPDIVTSILGFLNVFATITFLCLVRFVGKRRIYLTVLSGVCISSFIISCYGFVLLPNEYSSFNKTNWVPHLEGSKVVYIPTFFLILWSFCSYCGILMMPWMFLSELFPFKARGLAAGLAAAINYIMGFITIKTYYNLEKILSMPGVSLFYCMIASFGLILMFKIMPETENRSLEDIELHFSDSSKKITNWYIPCQNELRKSNK